MGFFDSLFSPNRLEPDHDASPDYSVVSRSRSDGSVVHEYYSKKPAPNIDPDLIEAQVVPMVDYPCGYLDVYQVSLDSVDISKMFNCLVQTVTKWAVSNNVSFDFFLDRIVDSSKIPVSIVSLKKADKNKGLYLHYGQKGTL